MAVDYEVFSSAGGRDSNQDRCQGVVLENAACWVLADGLGGHNGGELAAQLAVESIVEGFRREPAAKPERLRALLEQADAAVGAMQQEEKTLRGMRTTMVLLATDYNEAVWAHVGDSRLYHFQRGRIVTQTKDHSVPQALVDKGEITLMQLRHHEDRSRLLRSLGTGALRPDYSGPVAWQAGDAYLLCSDGFWEHVTEDEMELDLAKSRTSADWVRHMLVRLRSRVPQFHDNYSAVAVRIPRVNGGKR